LHKLRNRRSHAEQLNEFIHHEYVTENLLVKLSKLLSPRLYTETINASVHERLSPTTYLN